VLADGFVKTLRALALAALFAASLPVTAQQPAADPGLAPAVAADPQLEADVQELSHKLRCLVCQNQSIAESNAPLAVDLRNQVREQLASGRSKGDVVDYLVARYGDFVLYEPPVKGTTLLLWGGPALLLMGGAGWLAYRLQRRSRELAATAGLSTAERQRARELLAGNASSSPESPESRS
jgi:cytochrome c-type biogenesis protein CcmH